MDIGKKMMEKWGWAKAETAGHTWDKNIKQHETNWSKSKMCFAFRFRLIRPKGIQSRCSIAMYWFSVCQCSGARPWKGQQGHDQLPCRDTWHGTEMIAPQQIGWDRFSACVVAWCDLTWLASECLSCLNLYLCSDTVGEMVILPSVHCTRFHSSPGVHCCTLFVCCSTTARFWEKILAAPHRAALRAWNLAQCGQMCNNIYTGKPDWLQNLRLFMILWVGHSWSLLQLCWSLLCRLPWRSLPSLHFPRCGRRAHAQQRGHS